MKIQILKTPNGSFQAFCPVLPGCRASSETLQETHEKIQQAIAGYLASLDVALPDVFDCEYLQTEQ